MRHACIARMLPLLALLLAWPLAATAGVRLGGTRLVYTTDQQEATLPVQNTGRSPVLVQVWITELDKDSLLQAGNVPFVTTPPVFRLQPQTTQALRIRHLAPAQITDREQAYWLNVYEIPGRHTDAPSENLLEIATRTRIKLFMRPHGLKMPAATAADRLTWTLESNGASGSTLTVNNPSPYHVSFGEVGVIQGGMRVLRDGAEGSGGMVAPFSSQSFQIAPPALTPAAKAYAKVINDHGGMRAMEWPLRH
ncbi:hypothetical protein CEK00_09455 [Stenotrophomonas maltophilia]|uniref:Molecular chaperone n=1 Tax=Stenotrophomonas maltophilia TaxID=40324 RepID=A0A270N0C0_STEMA|nr:molecular chaperone [Stenotrophomonas maltophilia]PAM64652.1 hypothetical protein CEK00_21775 [Stenotrophomonas maltophilia]PAM71809.1 hypothetical protein CEK00_09455 [Stenotrophomonas maltophilia]